MQLQLGQDITEEDREFLAIQQQIKDEEKERINLKKQFNQLQTDYLKSLGKSLLGNSKMGQMIGSAFGGMMKFVKAAKLAKKALDAGAISASALMSALGIGIIVGVIFVVIKLISWIFKLANATRDAAVGFQRMTGATYAMGEQMAIAQKELESAGVTMDEMREQYTALYRETTVFTFASAQQQKQLAKTGAVLAELWVSSKDYAKSIQGMVKGMGVSFGEADNVMLEMRAHAMDIGVDVGQLNSQFAGASDSLQQFGSDGVKAFKDLSMISKITGMDLQRILDLTGKFDTFEDAAKMAGKLNAALGSNMVNAMDMMMTTDPVERFKMVRKAIDSTGQSFDEMSYYQKKMYTEMMGFKSEAELAQMMSGDMEGLAGNVGKTSAEYAQARKDAQSWQSTMDILKNTLKSLVPTFSLIGRVINEMMSEFTNSEDGVARIRNSIEELVNKALLPMLKDVDIPKLMKEMTGEGGALDRFATSMEEISETADQVGGVFETVGRAFSFLSGLIKLALLPVKFFVDLLTVLFEISLGFGFKIGEGMDIGTAAVMTFWDAIAALRGTWDWFLDSMSDFRDVFIKRQSPSLLDALQMFPDLVGKMRGAIKYITGPLEKMSDTLSAARERFVAWKDNFVNTWDDLRAKTPGKIKEIMNGIGDAFGFDAMGDRIANGIGKWKKGFDKGITDIKSWLGISSPSAEMEKSVGDPMVQGIISAFGNLGPGLALAAIEALEVLPDWAKTGLSAIGVDVGATKESLRAAMTTNTGATNDAGGNSGTPYQITLNLQLDRKTLSTEVVDIIGGQAFQAAR